MLPTTILTMVDGVRVVVPDSLDLITPYVLREQQDWFEDEIKFLRRLLEPGDKVIDIGANFYSGASARPRLEAIRNLRFGGAEMQRRLSLVQQRFDRPSIG